MGCNCICPKCKSILIARKGLKNQYHFAHYSSKECKGAIETALHMLAKEILLEQKAISLPMWQDKYGNNIPLPRIIFDDVTIEKKINDIIADVVMYKDNIPLIIEIAVTHKVDEIKKEKLTKIGISTLEIDLSEVDRNINKKELEPIICNNSKYKLAWIYNKKENILGAKSEYEYEIQLKNLKANRKAEVELENIKQSKLAKIQEYKMYSLIDREIKSERLSSQRG